MPLLEAEALADVVATAIKMALAPLAARLDAVERREVLHGRDGLPGRDGQAIIGPQGVKGLDGAIGPIGSVGPAGADGKDGAPGRDADPETVMALTAEIKALRDEMVMLKAAPAVADLLPSVREFVAAELAQLPPAPAGKDADPVFIARLVAEQVALLPTPKDGRDGTDGKDVDPEHVATVVKGMVAEAVSKLPAPKDGRNGTSVTPEDVYPVIAAQIAKAVADIPPAKDGAPGVVDMSQVDALVSAHVDRTMAALPRPKDGASVTAEDVAPLIASEVQKAVGALPVPKDGIGLLGALLDRDGHLVVTLSDGTVKDVGGVVGRDVDMALVAKMIGDEVAKIPAPKDGATGAPGRDGTLEHLKAVQSDDFRTVALCFKDTGEPIEGGVLTFPIVLDRGVFKAGTVYQAGDGVTWAGSFWIAQKATSEKPGEGATGWRLAVKRGADGKVGLKGDPGLNGKDGTPGRDGQKSW